MTLLLLQSKTLLAWRKEYGQQWKLGLGKADLTVTQLRRWLGVVQWLNVIREGGQIQDKNLNKSNKAS